MYKLHWLATMASPPRMGYTWSLPGHGRVWATSLHLHKQNTCWRCFPKNPKLFPNFPPQTPKGVSCVKQMRSHTLDIKNYNNKLDLFQVDLVLQWAPYSLCGIKGTDLPLFMNHWQILQIGKKTFLQSNWRRSFQFFLALKIAKATLSKGFARSRFPSTFVDISKLQKILSTCNDKKRFGRGKINQILHWKEQG